MIKTTPNAGKATSEARIQERAIVLLNRSMSPPRWLSLSWIRPMLHRYCIGHMTKSTPGMIVQTSTGWEANR
jgi:hypothetical protein